MRGQSKNHSSEPIPFGAVHSARLEMKRINSYMKTIILMFLMASVALAKELHFDVLETTQGKFTNATVISATANSVMVLYDGGAAGVPFANLPPAVQKEMGYDPAQTPAVTSATASGAEAVKVTNTPPAQALPPMPKDRMAALQLERSNAWQRVVQIVNRPVQVYARTDQRHVALYSPGWFHPGASRPDFNTVDVRKTQELVYAQSQYVTSDLNPGKVFLGQGLEFNAMTKIFYEDRSLPKRKLTEAEMIEINGLYRIIGRCEGEMERLQSAATTENVQSTKAEADTEVVVPGQAFANLRQIPQSTRVLYGCIGIGALIVGVIIVRLVKK